MPRTTLNIEGPILDEIKRMQLLERRPLGRLVSELLAQALAQRHAPEAPEPGFLWLSRPMRARVDLSDKEAVQALLDRPNGPEDDPG